MNPNIIDEYDESRDKTFTSADQTAILMIVDRLEKMCVRLDSIEKILRNRM